MTFGKLIFLKKVSLFVHKPFKPKYDWNVIFMTSFQRETLFTADYTGAECSVGARLHKDVWLLAMRASLTLLHCFKHCTANLINYSAQTLLCVIYYKLTPSFSTDLQALITMQFVVASCTMADPTLWWHAYPVFSICLCKTRWEERSKNN